MKKSTVNVSGLDEITRSQLRYAVFFADETITGVKFEKDELQISHNSDAKLIEEKVGRLVNRFSEKDISFKENILFDNRVETPYNGDIIIELKEKKIIKELEAGIYTFREPFTTIMKFFDDSFVSQIGKAFGAKSEYYPVVIHADSLNKTNHFVSFPEHIHFVTHLREDLDIIDSFSEDMREHGGWSEEAKFDITNFKKPNSVINPATCYHCYEGLKGETLDGDGIVVTAVSKAHRYESKNHNDFGRLMDFTMREIIFVGTPPFVRENRTKSMNMLMELFKKWELNCFVENANDPFFTNDYKVKASFQRNQELKYEFRMNVPYLNKTIAVSSSNYHGNTFGKAFDITAGKRPAVTGCLAFGLERWVMAFLAQYGLNEEKWPCALKSDYEKWRELNA